MIIRSIVWHCNSFSTELIYCFYLFVLGLFCLQSVAPAKTTQLCSIRLLLQEEEKKLTGKERDVENVGTCGTDDMDEILKLYCRCVVHLVVILNVKAKLIVVHSRRASVKGEKKSFKWRKIGIKFVSVKMFTKRISTHHFISSCISIKHKYLLIAFQLTAFESAQNLSLRKFVHFVFLFYHLWR